MRNTIRNITITLALALAGMPAIAANATGTASSEMPRLEKQIRHELVMLPFYSVFDHFQFQVEGDKVTLTGQVSRPTLKSSAERVVARVEGVGEVDNRIEVLPLSNHDDRIRLGVLYAIYGDSTLNRYGVRSVPPIHIIVKNGDVTLEGVVNREMEKNIAGIRANGVSGVFSVTNNLQVEVPAKG